MKKINEYKDVEIFLTDDFSFECKIGGINLKSLTHNKIIDEIDRIKGKHEDVDIPFIYVIDYGTETIKEGVIKKISHVGDYIEVLFNCENNVYTGRIENSYNNDGICIYDIKLIEQLNFDSKIVYVYNLICNKTNMKNVLINYIQTINDFENKVEESNKQLINLINNEG